MKKHLKILVFIKAIMVSVFLASLCFPDRPENGIRLTLESLPGIDVDYLRAVQGVRYSLPLSNYLFENISEIPELSQSLTQVISDSRFQIPALFHYSFQLLSSGAGGIGPPLPGTGTGASVDSPEELRLLMASQEWEIEGEGEWTKLPFEFQKVVVENLAAFHQAAIVFDAFTVPVREYLAHIQAETYDEILQALLLPWNQRELFSFSSLELPGQVDLRKLSMATRIVSSCLNDFCSLQELVVPSGFKACRIQSALGTVLISGRGSDTIAGDYALVIDTGGDDLYLGNTASTIPGKKPVAIVVDLQGNDHYLSDEHSLLAGVLGMSALMDLEGDDHYRTGRSGLAFSLYGTSLLYDCSGNDHYESSAPYTQAASLIGSALFLDLNGDDLYLCQSMSQAFGATYGVGIFYDHSGNDRYNTGPDPEHPYTPEQSFIQGAARGRWAEASDGQSLAGGMGVFIDRSGRDTYASRSFSQGASYYFGLGLFTDEEGDDHYRALSHSQGYAAHYSLAGFFEGKGDDSYNALSDKDRITQVMGSGRDFSVGIFLESYGNDDYHFGNRSVGVGDIQGIGVFGDLQGNDAYVWHQNTLNKGVPSLGQETGLDQGMAMGARIFTPTHAAHQGVFIDSGGDNTFIKDGK